MNLNVGDMIVAAGFGVIGNYSRAPEFHIGFAKVLEFRTVEDKPSIYCDLTSIGGETFQIEIPVAMVEENSGVRKLTRRDDLDKVYEVLSTKPTQIAEDWDARYRDHKGRLFSGDILKIAAVYRELISIFASGGIGYGDSKNLDVAAKFLKSEISLTAGISPEAVEVKIRSLVGLH